jgi:phosphopentomutase
MYILDYAIKQDKYGWFKDLYDHDEYTKVIKHPMCFTFMKNKINNYIVDIDQMKNDFELIFTNCFNFNPPKDKVHKEGVWLWALILKWLDKKLPKLHSKQEVSREEVSH